MADIVNLRRYRKQAVKQRADEQAAANRLVHGRSKSAKALDAARQDQIVRALDQHRIEPGDDQ